MQTQTQPEAMHERDPSWSPALRFAFRFLFSYFVLYSHGMIGLLPFSEVVLRKYVELWYPVVAWVGKDVLHLQQDIYLLKSEIDGVSNTAFGTVLFFCYVALALIAAAVWSLLDRKRPHYRRLYAWFRFALRFSLALAMIRYGAIKIIPAQMASPPPLSLLALRLGDFTRMRLLWLFTGTSPAYESLVGCAEMLGGVLLLFRRTTLLGALVCAADLTMVVILNFCYDVHVKIYSMHLLFMALLLIAPDLRRLADMLIFNRRVEPREERPLFADRRLDRLPQVFLIAFGLYVMWTGFSYGQVLYQRFHPPKPPLHGIWSVEELTVNGEEIPRATDPERWRTLLFQRVGSVRVEKAIGSWETFNVDVDPRQRMLRLGTEQRWRGRFNFAEPEEDVLTLDGQLDGKRTRIRLSRMALTRESFHWFIDLREGDEEAVKEAAKEAAKKAK
jgi:hypothetical protein